MKLSILIATLPERREMLQSLMTQLGTIPNDVEILTDDRPRGSVDTGTKRNDLIARAQGKYFCFIDDDDFVTSEYLLEIIQAIEQDPDCVTFQGKYFQDSVFQFDWTIKLGEAYEMRNGHVYRWPNHLSVMKKSLVAHVRFPPITQGEDYAWSKAIMEQGLLKTEVHIPKQLYHYYFRSKK